MEARHLSRQKPETEEEHRRRLAIAFATWKTARVSRLSKGFSLSLENGTIDDTAMIIDTGDEKRDLRLIGFTLGSRGVETLICAGDISIRPIEPSGVLPPYPEETFEPGPPDPVTQAFLRRNDLLFG